MRTHPRLSTQFRMFIATKALFILGLLLATTPQLSLQAQQATQNSPGPIEKGLRVFSAGHSFHVFVPGLLAQMAKSAGINDHVLVGLSSIGGSRVIQHWDIADDKFKTKENLRSGKVDVLTLAPIHLPDDGIEKFATLALEHNPNIRITIEEIWMPFDIYDPTFKLRPAKVDHNAATVEELHKIHAPSFKSMDEHIAQLNQKFGKPVLLAVPAGQAVVALREKIIAGKVPGIKTQAELFTDPLGHAGPPLQVLVAYCHYAVIYRKSPVGLPIPNIMARGKNPNWDDKLNKLLQEIAWEVVTQHPLSGVKASSPSGESAK